MNANSSNSINPNSNKNSSTSDSSIDASITNTPALQSATGGQGQQMWGGRVSDATDSFVAAFHASGGVDRSFARHDLQGSTGHQTQMHERVMLVADDE